MIELACSITNNSPRWTSFDVLRWKLVPAKFGGGISYIQKFKDSWVVHNKIKIKETASFNRLPAELLAGVCWIEVAGDPDFIDGIAFSVRGFDWSGPDFIDKYFTITHPPERTSFGQVSIQLRTAAKTLGLDSNDMSLIDWRRLAECLQVDVFNIELAGRHLNQLADYDSHTRPLSKESVRIIGARYNRGTGPSLDQIKRNTSYGDFIVNHWDRFSTLIA